METKCAFGRNKETSIVAPDGGHFEHSVQIEWSANIHHWNVWTVDEKLCQVWFAVLIQCV